MNGPNPAQAQISTAAVAAAVRLANRLGIGRIDPFVLRASRHISIRLLPLNVVARVVRADDAAVAGLRRELAVCRHLVERAAPVVPPTTELPAGLHLQDGYALTLWRFVEHVAANEDDGEQVASATGALRRVHDSLADCPEPLPSFWIKVDACRMLLGNASALPALAAADRTVLQAACDRILAALKPLPLRLVPIHGDAHLGNVLVTADGPRWTDFEAASMGPKEWDLGSFPNIDLAAFEPVDRELLSVLSDLRSLCVAVWCWDRYDIPEKRQAADYHLGRLKKRLA